MENSLLYPVNSASRRAVSLDGMWKFRFDPEGAGLASGWTQALPDPVSMPVPSSFCDLFTDKDSREYCGDFWYETDFFVPGEWQGSDVVLRFSSVTHRARVFVNGVEVTSHEGGFLPFNADVTDVVRYNARNRLTVLGNNELYEYTLPAGRTAVLKNGKKVAAPYFDFYNYAGIQRPVKLLRLPKERITDFSVNHRLCGADAQVDYTVTTNGGSGCTVEVYDAEDAFRAEMDKWAEVRGDRPVIFTEYGADTLAEEHKLPSVMWSQEYQNEYLDMNHRVFDSYDFVQGELVWNFADFQTTEGIMRVNGNKKGIFTRQRQPKDAAYTFRARWTALPRDYKG